MTLLAVLLFGTVSVFAQWDCDVSWDYDPGDDCQPENLPSQNTYFIRVTLSIYDVANTEQVTDPNPENTELESALDSYFDETQCQVEDYCDGNPPNTPSFTVTVLVEFVNSSTLETFCFGTGQETGVTCTDFYNTFPIDADFN